MGKTLKRTIAFRRIPVNEAILADKAFALAAETGGEPKVDPVVNQEGGREQELAAQKAARKTNLTPEQVEAAEAALAQPNAAGEVPVVFNPKW